MIPITQDRVGENGTCFRACVCSILELPQSQVPDFQAEGESFLDQLAEFLAPLGLYYVQLDANDPALRVMFKHGVIHTTIEGVSPRGGQHACVARNGVMVWDPHPFDGTGRGLAKVETYGLFCARL